MRSCRRLKSLWVPLVVCLTVFLLFRYVLFLGYVPSASMEPAIPAGSWILGLRIHGAPQRGDIVIFEQQGRYLVKRIAAIPGDTVYLDDYTYSVSINAELSGATRVLSVPENSYFVLGDNAALSVDSRFWDAPCLSGNSIIALVCSAVPSTQMGSCVGALKAGEDHRKSLP